VTGANLDQGSSPVCYCIGAVEPALPVTAVGGDTCYAAALIARGDASGSTSDAT